MTKDIYDKLVKWDKVFINAINLDFIHLSASEFGEIAKIYAEHFKVALTKSQMNCNACRLTALKKLGKEYVQAKEMWGPKKKKVGRPSKLSKMEEDSNNNSK